MQKLLGNSHQKHCDEWFTQLPESRSSELKGEQLDRATSLHGNSDCTEQFLNIRRKPEHGHNTPAQNHKGQMNQECTSF